MGMVISVRGKSQQIAGIKRAGEVIQSRESVSWLVRDPDKMEGKLLGIPAREEIPVAIREQLIVELYSK
jgi:small subunit ribosomal protein S4